MYWDVLQPIMNSQVLPYMKLKNGLKNRKLLVTIYDIILLNQYNCIEEPHVTSPGSAISAKQAVCGLTLDENVHAK